MLITLSVVLLVSHVVFDTHKKCWQYLNVQDT